MATETVPPDSQPDGLLLTVEEAAKRLRLGRTLVYRLISSGELESVTVGRLRRIPAECLDAPMFVKAFFSSFWESAKSWFC
jgi:excisionase family DNA binding protein